jgi:hypothetical protein
MVVEVPHQVPLERYLLLLHQGHLYMQHHLGIVEHHFLHLLLIMLELLRLLLTVEEVPQVEHRAQFPMQQLLEPQTMPHPVGIREPHFLQHLQEMQGPPYILLLPARVVHHIILQVPVNREHHIIQHRLGRVAQLY